MKTPETPFIGQARGVQRVVLVPPVRWMVLGGMWSVGLEDVFDMTVEAGGDLEGQG